jgi:hypothetical protein
MHNFRLVRLSLLCLMTAFAPAALAQLHLECNYEPIRAGRVSVYTLPDGSGDPLSNAYHWNGVPGHAPSRVNATIVLTLLYFGEPVVGYPAEDMWLQTSHNGLVLCPGGSIADKNTDIYGMTTFSGPIFGGGATDPEGGELCLVFVGGIACPDLSADIQFNSPDMNSDRMVNLSDVVMFADVFFGDYDYAADFRWDGVIDLSDVVLLAQGLGAECP